MGEKRDRDSRSGSRHNEREDRLLRKCDRLKEKNSQLERENDRLIRKIKHLREQEDCNINEIKNLKDKIHLLEKKVSLIQSDADETDVTGDASNFINDIRTAAEKVCEYQAEEALLKPPSYENMKLEPVSGLYYDYNSRLYYDAKRKLFYNGTSGKYYRYSKSRKCYDEVENKKDDASPPHRKRKSKSRPSSEHEDGEVSEDDKQVVIQYSSNPSVYSHEKEESQQDFTMKPCLRIIVTESDNINVGTLFIVTCLSSGTVGRKEKSSGKSSHDVLLEEEIQCSKLHAKITYQATSVDNIDFAYFIKDCSSTNGTFVNDKMLEGDESIQLSHGFIIKIGTTKLLCHIHPENETCRECEPGVVEKKVDCKRKVDSLKSENVVLDLKRKYGLFGVNGGDGEPVYKDRAQSRRKRDG